MTYLLFTKSTFHSRLNHVPRLCFVGTQHANMLPLLRYSWMECCIEQVCIQIQCRLNNDSSDCIGQNTLIYGVPGCNVTVFGASHLFAWNTLGVNTAALSLHACWTPLVNSHLCDSAPAHMHLSGRALTRQHLRLVRNVCYSCFCIIFLWFLRYKIAKGIKNTALCS